MTKQLPRSLRALDLQTLRAATGGMSFATSPKITLSGSGSSTTSSGQTSAIHGPSTSTSTQPQIAPV